MGMGGPGCSNSMELILWRQIFDPNECRTPACRRRSRVQVQNGTRSTPAEIRTRIWICGICPARETRKIPHKKQQDTHASLEQPAGYALGEADQSHSLTYRLSLRTSKSYVCSGF